MVNPGGSDGKESASNAGYVSLIPGSGRSSGEKMATHSSILVWRIPWTEEPGGLWSTGSQRVRHDWSDLAWIHIAVNSYNHKKAGLWWSEEAGGTHQRSWTVPTAEAFSADLRGRAEAGLALLICPKLKWGWGGCWFFSRTSHWKWAAQEACPYTPRIPDLKETHAPQCSSQHCLS